MSKTGRDVANTAVISKDTTLLNSKNQTHKNSVCHPKNPRSRTKEF